MGRNFCAVRLRDFLEILFFEFVALVDKQGVGQIQFGFRIKLRQPLDGAAAIVVEFFRFRRFNAESGVNLVSRLALGSVQDQAEQQLEAER